MSDPDYADTVIILRGQVAVDDDSPYAWVPDAIVGVTADTGQALECFGDKALKFAAAGDNVRYDSADAKTFIGQSITGGNDIWTMEAWVYQDTSVVMGLLSYRPPASVGWAFTSTGFRAYMGTYSDTWLSVSAPAAGVWSHRALVRNGSSLVYYIDGVAAQSITNSDPITVNSASVHVGCSSTNTSEQPFTGWMYLRYTLGVARYTADFTPPNNFAPTA